MSTATVGRPNVWAQEHPLPDGWAPTIRRIGFADYELWEYSVAVDGDLADGRRHVIDGGRWWLPAGLSPEAAAWELCTAWQEYREIDAAAILAGEIDRLVWVVRRRRGQPTGVVHGSDF